MALGIRKAQSAAPSLERLLREDPEPIVRAYAAMALGQILSKDSIILLRDRLTSDSHRDVRHQCELAIGQIERGLGATPDLRQSFVELDESTFESLRVGSPAPPFVLDDTEGQSRSLDELRNGQWIVLIWVFADWCPVCHGEFRELMELRDAYEQAGVRVATVETHDTWRGRVMVGKEIEPGYWFAKEAFKEAYTNKIWWPHLLDRAGAVGAAYGVDPMAFAVHGEFINRPTTVIIDPDGIVRFAYYGTYWGDRPSIEQTLEMIKSNTFDFEHPSRLSPEPAGQEGDQPRP
ncbi:MAG: redoxin domain-containing protein [bacterium]|nr:redoxin domain-containing protein [bacterium]